MSNPDQEGSMRRKIKEKELLNNQEEGGGMFPIRPKDLLNTLFICS